MDGQVLTKETKDLLTKAIDDAIKLPFYLEWGDRPVAKLLISIVDQQADRYIPDAIDPLINAGIKNVFSENYKQAAIDLGSALSLVGNIKYLEESTEKALAVDGMRFLLRFLEHWREKRQP